jgi:hypothetical protein
MTDGQQGTTVVESRRPLLSAEVPADPGMAELRRRLLELGGEGVYFFPVEPDLDALLERGRHFPTTRLRMKFIEDHHCHENVSMLWYRTRGRVGIATGYALSDDGFWHQHSWGHEGEALIETTSVRRDVYFGVELNFEDSVRFAFSNARHWIMERAGRDMASGRGFRKCVEHIRAVATGEIVPAA